MNKAFKLLPVAALLSISTTAFADDNYDLDDIRGWDLVPMEACLDSALDTKLNVKHQQMMRFSKNTLKFLSPMPGLPRWTLSPVKLWLQNMKSIWTVV